MSVWIFFDEMRSMAEEPAPWRPLICPLSPLCDQSKRYKSTAGQCLLRLTST